MIAWYVSICWLTTAIQIPILIEANAMMYAKAIQPAWIQTEALMVRKRMKIAPRGKRRAQATVPRVAWAMTTWS